MREMKNDLEKRVSQKGLIDEVLKWVRKIKMQMGVREKVRYHAHLEVGNE